MAKLLVPVGVSAHHIHLTKEDFEALFGEGKTLTHKVDLSQPGQFAAEEQLTVVSLDPKGKSIERVRILGPLRSASQVELLRSECSKCRIAAPTRSSGDVKGSGACKLVNPLNGNEIILNEGVIVADRHIHFSPEQGKEYGVSDREVVSVKVEGRKGGVMGQVICRVKPEFTLDFHIDVDDASAFELKQGDQVEIIK